MKHRRVLVRALCTVGTCAVFLLPPPVHGATDPPGHAREDEVVRPSGAAMRALIPVALPGEAFADFETWSETCREPAEEQERADSWNAVESYCPPSGSEIPGGPRVLAGDTLHVLCGEDEYSLLEGRLTAAEVRSSSEATGSTIGVQTVLFIRVNFPDDLTDPQSAQSCQSMMDNLVSPFFVENSYGLTSMVTTVTPLITLPLARASYIGWPWRLMADAVAQAAQPPYNYNFYDYDRIAVRYILDPSSAATGGGAGGTGNPMVPGIVLTGPAGNSSPGIAYHEFGHTFGLRHANAWLAAGDSVVGTGTNLEYGNRFDAMGTATQPEGHFNAYEKNRLEWLPSTNVQAVTASGTYRLHSFDDVAALTPGSTYALRIPKDAERDYWLDHRRRFTSNAAESNGVEVLWDAWAQNTGHSQLLDTTPGSHLQYGSAGNFADRDDSALRLGWTLADEVSGIFFTPVAKESSGDHWIDVEVNLSPSPTNRPPTCVLAASRTSVSVGGSVTFTATASDPDSDSPAYGWDFGWKFTGDKTPVNGPVITRSFPAAGEFVVRCVASDKKGGRAADSVLVRVGNPSGFRISGSVTAGGLPLEGARVTAGSSVTWTDSDGTYTIPEVPAGTYSVTATKGFHACSPSNFDGTVTVGPNAQAKNFACVRSTFTLRGQVQDGSGIPVHVTATSGSAVYGADSDSDGFYAISGVPIGAYTLAVDLSGGIGPDFANPVLVEGADVSGLDFVWPPILITTASLPAGVVGTPYSQTIVASGGNPARYDWSTAGSLPPGLSLSPTGTPAAILAGTPSAAGTYLFTVTATDLFGNYGSKTFQIVVGCAPAHDHHDEPS